MLGGILTARLLGAAGYGTLGTIILFTSTINNLVSFRMNELVVRYVGRDLETGDLKHAQAIYKSAALTEMLASLLAFGLVVVLAPVGAHYFTKDPALAPLFVLYGLVILVNLIAESSTGLLQVFNRFSRIAALNLTQAVITLGLIGMVFLAMQPPDSTARTDTAALAGVLAAYLVGKAVSALGISLSALREAGRRWGRDWWRIPLASLHPQRSELARFAISTNASATISLVTKDSELLWVSLLRGPTEAGYYRLALALANLVQMPVDPLPQTTYPELSRQTAKNNWPGVRLLLRQGSQLAGGYSILAMLFLIVAGKPLISLLYTPEFLPAYPALMIVLTGLLVANIFYWRRVMLLALGQAGFPARLNLILALIKIALTLLLVPTYGYLASAALLAGFYICGSLISGWKIRAELRRREAASTTAAGTA